MTKAITLNEHLYCVDDKFKICEYEIRELVRFFPHGEGTYCVFKIDDGSNVGVYPDGTIEEWDIGQPRTFYRSYKEALKVALKGVDEAIEFYSQFSEGLKTLIETRKTIQEELKR
ncbi:MAG: hypothetical protein J6Q39_04150 [Bacteroidales bacterium]|nr:hypothetical protein [Bacteroidales bacterium]